MTAVANFLYSDKGVQFLSESIQKKIHALLQSGQRVQSVRSATFLMPDGKLSSYGRWRACLLISGCRAQ